MIRRVHRQIHQKVCQSFNKNFSYQQIFQKANTAKIFNPEIFARRGTKQTLY